MTTEKNNKIMDAKEAVSKFVTDGSTVFLGGFGHLYPYSLAHEVIRQGKKDLVLCKHSPELAGDQMIGAGLVRKVIFGWFGNPGVGLSNALRRAVEKGVPHRIEVEEHSHFTLTLRLRAGAMNVPFLPTRTVIGSDLEKYNKIFKFMDCPFTGQKLCYVPAINPDVALIHVQRADVEGNSQAWGIVADLKEGAFSSSKVIVSTEDIVPTEMIRRDPNRTVIPSFRVDAVVHEPWGAHPSYAQGYYDRDNEFYFEYDQMTRDVDGMNKFLREWVFDTQTRTGYLKKLGVERLLKLKPKPFPGYAVDYGYYT